MATAADRITLLQTFVRIVDAGSLSAAAAQLGATQPTISRRLQALEQSLGLTLVKRSTHSLSLTEDGARCYEHARALLSDWDHFESELRGATDAASGTLRIVVPHAFGQQQLIVPLAEYLRRHPRVDVEWLLHDAVPDFQASGVDCAINVGALPDESVVALRLGEVPRVVVAAPEVAALLQGGGASMSRQGAGSVTAPSTTPGRSVDADPAVLARLPWLALKTFYRAEVELLARDGRRSRFAIEPRLATDSVYAMRSAALAGLGACLISAWVVTADVAEGRLRRLAPAWHGEPLPVHLIYPYARGYPARLRRFIEIVRTTLPAGMGAAAWTHGPDRDQPKTSLPFISDQWPGNEQKKV